MSAFFYPRPRMQTASAFAAVFLVSLAASAFHLDLPSFAPWLWLLLFGWIGVALGQAAAWVGAPNGRAAKDSARPEVAKFDQILRSVARLLQTEVEHSAAYSEKLDGSNNRLAQQENAGPVRDIVLALIEDNRRIGDSMSRLRDQLEDSRLQVLQLQNNLERAEEAGVRDVVTLLGNRRYFEAAFAEEIGRARRTEGDLCLALADLDRFKQVNDRFGHVVGDRILRLFAEILAQNVRRQDKVARFGGEEFAVLFPGAKIGEAYEAAERVRKALESKQWTLEPSGESIGKITVSFGIGRLKPNDTSEDLLQRADSNLYLAKTKGRNRIVAEQTGVSGDFSKREDRRAVSV